MNGELARGALEEPLVEGLLPDDPPWEAPIAFFAAMHYLALAGKAPRLADAYARNAEIWPAARDALAEHLDWVRGFVRDQPIQTNEVRRCWALLPGFLSACSANSPVDLVELGPSGGLNLCWDRFRYRYPGLEWGPESPVVLAGEWRGPFPREVFEASPSVRRRVGIDRSPVDVASEEGALLLQAFLWADDPARIERMRAAIELGRADPPELLRGNYVELLPSVLANADPEALTIVFHSASTQYVDDAAFGEIEAVIAGAGARRRLAWLSMEPERGTDNYGDFFLDLREWPDDRRRRLAQVHYHGAWVDWRE